MDVTKKEYFVFVKVKQLHKVCKMCAASRALTPLSFSGGYMGWEVNRRSLTLS